MHNLNFKKKIIKNLKLKKWCRVFPPSPRPPKKLLKNLFVDKESNKNVYIPNEINLFGEIIGRDHILNFLIEASICSSPSVFSHFRFSAIFAKMFLQYIFHPTQVIFWIVFFKSTRVFSCSSLNFLIRSQDPR